MHSYYYRCLAKLTGKNPKKMPVSAILGQLHEPRPLPMGRKEWDEWSSRIIAGAGVTATYESQAFALANLLMHLGPTEDHKEDVFFIKSLRKFCVNQVAEEIRQELYAAKKAKENPSA